MRGQKSTRGDKPSWRAYKHNAVFIRNTTPRHFISVRDEGSRTTDGISILKFREGGLEKNTTIVLAFHTRRAKRNGRVGEEKKGISGRNFYNLSNIESIFRNI